MRFLLITALLVCLSACGSIRAQKMDESNAAYKACLSQNPMNISACESQRLIYEADRDAVLVTKSSPKTIVNDAPVMPNKKQDCHMVGMVVSCM